MEDELKTKKNKDKKNTLYKGPRPKIYDKENNLFEFIEFNRKLNNPITTWCIANEFLNIIQI